MDTTAYTRITLVSISGHIIGVEDEPAGSQATYCCYCGRSVCYSLYIPPMKCSSPLC